MPAFIRISGHINKINFSYGIIDGVEKKIEKLKQNQIVKDDTNYDFEKNIIINQLNFSYNNKSIFENSEIEITKGKTHAIILQDVIPVG